ncbi:nucleotidyltransferase [Halanaerobium congolense]|uniref:nucleotidyltransferase domain-containing protein n=1 Tax=Halanaerobium congolense TaxID=54121 RepID=UPI00088ABA0F|nr:nucleotidyltransferase [Halanaerobium congolense]SDH60958.1 hypothetical protein SAMN04515651_11837 [Halanaerobium congolense]
MADLQKYFNEFHEIIRLSFDDNAELREKRDIILNKFFNNRADDVPKPESFNQGSYAMSTGVKPIDDDYDIDVGLEFNISKDDYKSLEVKNWVYDVLKDHTKSVEIKNPCVTVTYHKEDEPIYHVDLALYSNDNADGKMYLAKGKEYSNSKNKRWEPADPKGLIKAIQNKFSDKDDRAQFRRIIRYLKRWKDIKFSSDGNAAPLGIGITVAAYKWFNVSKEIEDIFSNKYKFNDLNALINFIEDLISRFNYMYYDEEYVERLQVELPFEPYDELFKNMTNKQMTKFKNKLEELISKLREASDEVDPVVACENLVKVFGDDYPIPEKEETAEKKNCAFTPSNSSA